MYCTLCSQLSFNACRTFAYQIKFRFSHCFLCRKQFKVLKSCQQSICMWIISIVLPVPSKQPSTLNFADIIKCNFSDTNNNIYASACKIMKFRWWNWAPPTDGCLQYGWNAQSALWLFLDDSSSLRPMISLLQDLTWSQSQMEAG